MSKRKAAFPIVDLACGGGGALVVEKVIKQVPGVLDVYVNPATETAYVEYVAEEVTEEAVADAIHKAGHKTALPARLLRLTRS